MLSDRYFYAFFNRQLERRIVEYKKHEWQDLANMQGRNRVVVTQTDKITFYLAYHSMMTEADALWAMNDKLFLELPHPDWLEYRGVTTDQESEQLRTRSLFDTVGQGGQ